jgi:hypothetical protein
MLTGVSLGLRLRATPGRCDRFMEEGRSAAGRNSVRTSKVRPKTSSG